MKNTGNVADITRTQIQQGTDVAVQKQIDKLASLEEHDVAGLAQARISRELTAWQLSTREPLAR